MTIEHKIGVNDLEYIKSEIIPYLHNPLKPDKNKKNWITKNIEQINEDIKHNRIYSQLFFLVDNSVNIIIKSVPYALSNALLIKEELIKISKNN